MNNILIVLPNDSLGGAEQYLKMIAHYHKNHNVKVVFLKKLENTLWSDTTDNVSKIYLSKKSKVFGVLKLFWYFLFSKKERFEYIYTSHVFVSGLTGILISLGLIKKEHWVARESTSIFKRYAGPKLFLYKVAYRLGYGKVDLLICQTEYMKNQFIEGLPVMARKIEVLPNPVDTKLINEKEKEQLNLKENFIVSAGRFIPEKGYDILINAFSKIIDKESDLKLIILGDGPLRNNLERLVLDLQLERYVLMPGMVNNVYPYFKMAKLCVVSSRIEGFPNVLLQMMSQNTKVVSTLCAGGIDRIPGLATVPPSNQKALEKAILGAIDSDTEQNRIVFDTYLKSRNIDSFMEKIDQFFKKSAR